MSRTQVVAIAGQKISKLEVASLSEHDYHAAARAIVEETAITFGVKLTRALHVDCHKRADKLRAWRR